MPGYVRALVEGLPDVAVQVSYWVGDWGKIAVASALEAIQVHGGYGYVREYLVERFLRDAKVTEIYEGLRRSSVSSSRGRC